MKILAIRIKNLASLEGNTEIDFTAEPLCSAGIFAITGATGAGKSTILDALCLALYGKTPRYLQAKEAGIEIHDVQGSSLSQGDVRSILRDGTADGFSEVDFRGVDNQDYCASWSVRRARNKVEGSMQSDSITLKNITSNVAIPGKKQETLNEIARLVGLNFEQFTRSVLLAQGDFTAFMKANKDDKSSLLEKLTGTHIYTEISKNIYEKFKLEEQQLRDLNSKKEGIPILNEEALKALLEEQSLLEIQIQRLEKEIANLKTEIDWHEQFSKYKTNHEEANHFLLQANEGKTNAQPRRQKLYLAEQVQQTRTWADALNHAQKQHEEKTVLSNALKESLSSLEVHKEKLETELLAAGTDFAEKSKSLQDALPLLAQAKKLDTLLIERKEQLDKAKAEADSASENSNEQQKTLKAKQGEFENLNTQIKKIADWQAENAERSPIAENRHIILSKLLDAQKLLDVLQSAEKEIGELNDKIKTDESKKIEIEERLDQLTKEWEIAQKSYDSQFKELLLIPIETINLNKGEVDRDIENAINAQANWQLYYNAISELENLNQKQAKDQKDNQDKQTLLKELDQQLIVAIAQKDTAKKLLEQAQLASTENVEKLRENLIDDEPCAVCGSTDHPYVAHNPQLENVMATLATVSAEKERIHLELYRQHNALEQALQSLKENITTQSEAILEKQTKLAIKKQSWAQFDIAKESDTIADEKRADWIAERLKTLKAKQADLFEKIQAHTRQKQQLEADKIQIDQLKETIGKLADQVKDLKSKLSLYQEQQGNHLKVQHKATADLSLIEKAINPYFAAQGWMENWKVAPEAFVGRIDTFAKNWEENKGQLEQYTLQKSALEATLKELEIQGKSFAVELDKKTANYTAQHQNYQDLKQQRVLLFEGKATEEVETQFNHSVTEAQKKLDQLKEMQQELNNNRIKAQTQYEELQLSLNTLATAAQNALKKLEDWLKQYNQKNTASLSMSELQELLTLDHDWIDAERKALQSIDDEVTRASSILLERKQSLEVHQQKVLSERPLEELNALITAVKADTEQQKHKRGEIGFQLQQDVANKNQIGDLLKSIATQESITENWSKLNEMIGSADGKKFRQIAQEYTLDVLLGYANIHLQVLTSRYKIERIPSTLGLQVVDQDMGDEVRSVYSLSGGESFLASLALALGLASLSSSRMKVESLFIDEGFGSLDPTTLNIAMDALERLHNQGRKVGVISHVQEMTERIPVQIKVSKQQSGKSLVEVIGY